MKRTHCPKCHELLHYYEIRNHNAVGADCCGLWYFQRRPYLYTVRNPQGKTFRCNNLSKLIDEAFHAEEGGRL